MTRRARLWGWVTDWRNGATLAATIFMVVLVVFVTDAIEGRREAFDALERQTIQQGQAREAASRRIDLLQARIDELVGKGETNAAVLGQLVGEVEALRAQVRALGGDPVVDDRTAVTSTTARSRSAQPLPATTTTARPTTTTAPPGNPRPQPDPQPEPGRPCLLELPVAGCVAPNQTRRPT